MELPYIVRSFSSIVLHIAPEQRILMLCFQQLLSDFIQLLFLLLQEMLHQLLVFLLFLQLG